jgi:hypothetical protein
MGQRPAEPVKTYVSRGGDEKEMEGRACLCGALEDLPLGSAKDPRYDADNVIDYLYQDVRRGEGRESAVRPRPAD